VDLIILYLIEREIKGEKVPEPVAISNAQTKTYVQISNEIRAAQHQDYQQLGNLRTGGNSSGEMDYFNNVKDLFGNRPVNVFLVKFSYRFGLR